MRIKTQSGLTLLEMVIAMILLAGLVFAVSNVTLTVQTSQRLTAAILATGKAGRRVLDRARLNLATAVFFAQNTAGGNAYLDLLDLQAAPPRLGTSRLPTVDEQGIFHKESAGGTQTGNLLCFARRVATFEHDAGGGREYRIPVYRFHLLYLSELTPGPQGGRVDGLDLCHWTSEPLADGLEIDRIEDPAQRSAVLVALRDPGTGVASNGEGVEAVWRVGGDPAATNTLRMITPAGQLSDDPMGSRGTSWKILARQRSPSLRLLGPARLSVATNHAPAHFGVGRFGVKDGSGQGFPHGFEVQIVGPSSGRKVLVSLALTEAKPGVNLASFRQHIVAATTRGVTL